MEITIKKFDSLIYKSIFTFSLMLCISVCFGTNDDLDPLDLLESDLAAEKIEEVNVSFNWQPFELWRPETFTVAAINLLAKMENAPPDLQTELQRLINQINSVEFKAQDKTPQSLIVVPQDNSKPVPDKVVSEKTPMAEKSEMLEVAPSVLPDELNKQDTAAGQITPQTLQLLDSLLQQPRQINNPLQLADILFRSDCLKEAAVCYHHALEKINADDNGLYEDKAWVLFQIGNCLHKDDPATALKMYNQLIVEFPDSLWTDAAKVKSNIIDWYVKEKPDTMINGRSL